MNTKEILDIISSRKVILIAGEDGRGKSLSGTALIFMLCVLSGSYNILSNIPLYFGKELNKLFNVTSLNSSSEFDKDHKKTRIFHDELQRDFGSRDFASSSAKILSKFSVDFRKDDSQLIGTIQFMDRLDTALNEIVQIVIIPTFIHTYSNNAKEDNKIRLEKKDFWVLWKLQDKQYDEAYELKLNLYPYIKFYDTNFKPYPLVINHGEYLDKQEKNLTEKKFDNLTDRLREKLSTNCDNWNESYHKLI